MAALLFPYKDLEDHSFYSLQVGSLKWPFPVGLAAGLDKNGEGINFFSRLNFGSLEIGTVTPLPQDGNMRPRIFRYPKEFSLRNSMGFPSIGSAKVLQNLSTANDHHKIIGVNLGKNKATPLESAGQDYEQLYKTFAGSVDYQVVNVSSPNTPHLRDLQKIMALEEIFKALEEERSKTPCPLFLKISPDIALSSLDQTIALALKYRLEGLIATNTTVIPERGIGGISGGLLSFKADLVRTTLLKKLKDIPDLTLIGVGGISSYGDIWKFWKDGGKLVQIYTSFIYGGPSLLNDIKNKITETCIYNKVSSLEKLLDRIDEMELPPSLRER